MDKFCPPFKNASPIMISQGFKPGIHEAVDIVGVFGEMLVAPFDCVIANIVQATKLDGTTNEVLNGCGINMVALSDPTMSVVYWHCLPVFPVKVGDRVKRGQIVAQMGNTGLVATGGQWVSVDDREKEYNESTPTNLPKKGVHAHVILNINNGVTTDIRSYWDWTEVITYDAITTIKILLDKIGNLLK